MFCVAGLQEEYKLLRSVGQRNGEKEEILGVSAGHAPAGSEVRTQIFPAWSRETNPSLCFAHRSRYFCLYKSSRQLQTWQNLDCSFFNKSIQPLLPC